MKFLKRCPLPALLALAVGAAWPLEVRANETIVNWASGETIPDDDTTGLADTREVASTITSLTQVIVRLNIAGGWNGDLHATLQHESGYAVLLNRPGRDAFTDAGSDGAGFQLILTDDATQDVHYPGTWAITSGTFQPDARSEHPLEVLDTSPRTEFLSNFQGLPASGEWTLYLADVSGANVSTLVSWGLTLRGTSSPAALYDQWAAGLSPADALPSAAPHGGGLSNVLKYAFNLNALGPDRSQLAFGAGGTSGLPAHQVNEDASTITLTVEYLRRRDSGLIYTPKYASELSPASFLPMTGEPAIAVLDACWERVVVSQTFNRATTPRVFATVEVQFP